jgi:hypothetical protein
MTSLEQYSNRPYVSFSERMRENAARRQMMQDDAANSAFVEQKNQLELDQMQQKLQQDQQNYQQGFGGNVPSSIQEYNFFIKLSPRQRALYLRAKAPNSQIQFENMGMTDDMGDMGQQEMVAPPMQQRGMLLGLDNLDADINALARTTAPIVQGPPMPTQRKPVGQGRMPQGAPLPPQGPSMSTQGAPLPPAQNGNINTAQRTKIAPPVDLGNGEFGFNGKGGYDEKTANMAYRSALSVEAAEQKKRNELKIEMPTLEANAKETLDAIEKLEKSKGLPAIVGNPFSLSKINQGAFGAIGNYWGSDAANAYTNLKTIKGQRFLQAYDALRGAAGITEIEGQTGSEAIANLDSSQDIDQFRENLAILKRRIKNNLRAAKEKAGVLPTTQGAAQPMMPSAGGNAQKPKEITVDW